MLSYQRRYQMTQKQRINRFRQQRDFRSLRDPPFNFSGGTSTYERETTEDEEQLTPLMLRPTTPTFGAGMPRRAANPGAGWSPELMERNWTASSTSWRGSSSLGMGSRESDRGPVQTRQPRLRMLHRSGGGGGGTMTTTSSNNSSSRSGEDVVMVESNNCVSAPQLVSTKTSPPKPPNPLPPCVHPAN